MIDTSIQTDDGSNAYSTLVNTPRASVCSGPISCISNVASSSNTANLVDTSTNSSISLYPSTPPTVITTNAPRVLPHLQPQRFLPLLGQQSSSTSPTSTCSSPLNHHLLDTSSAHLLGASGLAQLTPPQSAPPQKTSYTFFVEQRYRSKS